METEVQRGEAACPRVQEGRRDVGLEPDPRIRSESFAARLRPPCSHLSPRLLVKEDLALPSVDFKRNKNLFGVGG